MVSDLHPIHNLLKPNNITSKQYTTMTTTTMNTTVKEMSFNELNTQIDELKKRIEELVSERETRKEEAVNNWKRHMELVMEDTRILIEMGINPDTLTFESVTDEPETNSIIEVEPKKNEENKVFEELEVIEEPEVAETPEVSETSLGETETDVEIPSSEPTCEPSVVSSVDEREHYKDEDKPLLTPYYKIWGMKTINKEKPSRTKETVDTTVNPYTGKRMVSKLHMPFYKLFTARPIRTALKLGNRKYKKSYPDPEETRVVSADGYSPTLTYTHSDFYVWVGPKYNEHGEIVSDTPLVGMKEVA